MPEWTVPPPRRDTTLEGGGLEVLLVRWDPALGVAFISHPWGLVLGTAAEIESWRAELFNKLSVIEKERGGRFPIVVCVDGVMIRPSVAEDYGKVARAYSERFARGLARYSHKPNGVGQMITAVAMNEGFRANLFASRSEAVSHVLGSSGSQRPA
jgi:hypothetical protein